MMRLIVVKRGFYIPVLCFLINFAFSESVDSALFKIEQKQTYFLEAATLFNINQKYLKAIVFTERTLNFDWKDEAFDVILAETGRNSSIGFCQIKLKTAYWIEVTLSDSTSEFFPGKIYQSGLSISKSPKEIISKLQEDSLNIYYAAAYIKIIQEYWEKQSFQIHNRAEILGTLYSTGLFRNTGEIREPNSNPKQNLFGKKVLANLKYFNCN